MIKRLETHAIVGRMNASYIYDIAYKLTKGQNKGSQQSNVLPCLALL